MKNKLIKFALLLIAIIAIFWPLAAFADPASAITTITTSEPSAFARIGQDIATVLISALGVLVTALIAKLIHAAEKRLKIDVPDAWEQKIGNWIDLGIHYAEEQGRKGVDVASTKLGKYVPDKLDTAAKFVLDMADDKKLVAKGEEWLKKMIEARLQVMRKNDDAVVAGQSFATLAETVKTEPPATTDGIATSPVK